MRGDNEGRSTREAGLSVPGRYSPRPHLHRRCIPIGLARHWHSSTVKMKAICAWCESEGRPSDLGEREPFYNPATTHCICAYHQKRLLELLPSKSFPDAEVLIVVRPNDTALHNYLQRAFAGLRGVKVIMERRAGDRRAAQYPVADERRLVRTRRIRQGQVSSLGYTVVRFTPKAIVFRKAVTRRRQRGPETVPRTLV